MKQIVYNFDWLTLAGALVASQGMEDGYWEVNIATECVTTVLPPLAEGASRLMLPGHVTRITGIRLTKVPDLGFMCVEVKNGLITEVGFDPNRNQSRPVESGQGAGEDSGPAPSNRPASRPRGFKPIDAR